MTTLEKLTDPELAASTERVVAEERAKTSEVLDHLRENDKRRLYAKLGYSSLYDYCTRGLRYCPASAQLRIDAMRLSREVPEVKAALEDGRVTLSSVGVLQKAIRNEGIRAVEEKRELFQRIEGKSRPEAERELASELPVAPKEQARVISSNQTEIRFVAEAKLMEMIEAMKAKLRRKGVIDPSLAEVFEAALKKSLGIHEEVQRPAASPGEGKKVRRPYLTVTTRREVARKAQGQCTYVSPISGRRCEERYILDFEHRTPFAKGGSSEIGNLTLHCPAHNRLRAIEEFGEEKMRGYLRS